MWGDSQNHGAIEFPRGERRIENFSDDQPARCRHIPDGTTVFAVRRCGTVTSPVIPGVHVCLPLTSWGPQKTTPDFPPRKSYVTREMPAIPVFIP